MTLSQTQSHLAPVRPLFWPGFSFPNGAGVSSRPGQWGRKLGSNRHCTEALARASEPAACRGPPRPPTYHPARSRGYRSSPAAPQVSKPHSCRIGAAEPLLFTIREPNRVSVVPIAFAPQPQNPASFQYFPKFGAFFHIHLDLLEFP